MPQRYEKILSLQMFHAIDERILPIKWAYEEIYLYLRGMFTFKQFEIHQDRCAMKVGTDGVLLGAWAPVEKSKRILDIGTGSGLVAIMMAQRIIISSLGILVHFWV